MEFIKYSILLLIFFTAAAPAAPRLPRFLTKQSIENIRFIDSTGRYTYYQKKPGVLNLSTNFRNQDFVTVDSNSAFIMSGSRDSQKIILETIPNYHTEPNLLKNHKISVLTMGNVAMTDIGEGRNPRLHLNDEWITWFMPYEKTIHVQQIKTKKNAEIKLSNKINPFFQPQMVLLNPETLVYTDMNEQGYEAILSTNISTKKTQVIYKTPRLGNRLEICSHKGYIAYGEFPYTDTKSFSKISISKNSQGYSLNNFIAIYQSSDNDIGRMVCLENSIYFVKTTEHDKKLGLKKTEAAQINLTNNQVIIKSDLEQVSQIINMDGRILIPLRENVYVLEGLNNLGEDSLKSPEAGNNKSEDLKIGL